MQRSGTSLIHHGVRGHPQISAFENEVAVTRFFEKGASFFCYDEELGRREKERAPMSLFDCLAGLTASEDTKLLGVKSLPLDSRQARRLVDGIIADFPTALILRVKRRDVVARYGSLVKSKGTGIWKLDDLKDKSIDPNPSIRVNKYDLIDYLLESYKIERELDKLYETHKMLTIDYESDILAYEESNVQLFEDVFTFLDVEPIAPAWLKMTKLSPPPEDYIVNYSDLHSLATELNDALRQGASPKQLARSYGRPLYRRLVRSLRWHFRHPRITSRKVQNLLRSLSS